MHLRYNGVKKHGSSANLRQIDDAGMKTHTGVTKEKQGEAFRTSLHAGQHCNSSMSVLPLWQ